MGFLLCDWLLKPEISHGGFDLLNIKHLPCLIAPFLLRSVTKLLEDLVYFVTGGTNSGQDVLEVVFSKPNRERQKLMREQNILKQVSERWHTGLALERIHVITGLIKECRWFLLGSLWSIDLKKKQTIFRAVLSSHQKWVESIKNSHTSYTHTTSALRSIPTRGVHLLQLMTLHWHTTIAQSV